MMTLEQKRRDLRRTGLQALLLGLAVTLVQTTGLACMASNREDIISSAALVVVLTVAGTALSGPSVRSAGFLAGSFLALLYMIVLFALVPVPGPHH